MSKSEIAELRERIANEYMAAKQGLSGVAITARHAFITKRMENMELCRQRLNALVGEEESIKLVAETLEKC